MFEILNISNKTITICGLNIGVMQTQEFDRHRISDSIKSQIETLAEIGYIKIVPKVAVVETEKVNKKSSKKSK